LDRYQSCNGCPSPQRVGEVRVSIIKKWEKRYHFSEFSNSVHNERSKKSIQIGIFKMEETRKGRQEPRLFKL
jgi:hypothetical protein